MRYKIKEMSIGEVLDLAVELLRNHFALLLGVTLYLYVPFMVIQGYQQSGFIGFRLTVQEESGSEDGMLLHNLVFFLSESSRLLQYHIGYGYLSRVMQHGSHPEHVSIPGNIFV